MPAKNAEEAHSDNDDDDDFEGSADSTGATQQQTPKPWNCPACTFLNDPLRRDCELCGTWTLYYYQHILTPYSHGFLLLHFNNCIPLYTPIMAC